MERFARSFGAPIAPPTGWKLVETRQPAFEFIKGDEGAFVCTLQWCDAFSPDTIYRFHNLPGAPAGLTFKMDGSVVGKAMQVSVESSITGTSFTTYNNLFEKVAERQELAPTEVVDEPPDVDALEDGEWQGIDGTWRARRQGNGSYVVKLAADYDARLVAGCDVRFTQAECDIAELITRLPLVIEAGIVLDIPVNLSSEKEMERVGGLQMRKPPSVALPSVDKPPIPMETVEADLGSLQYKLGACAKNGDCWLTAPMAGRELTVEEAAKPSMATLDDITDRRKSVYNLLLANSIGGMDGATVRQLEQIGNDKDESEALLSDFCQQGFWVGTEEHLNAFMMLGLSIDLGRPILVFEKRGDDQINADALLYGARDSDGALRRTSKEPITISSYTNVAYRDALSFLRAKPDVSVVLYDREARHFEPFLVVQPEVAMAAPPAPAPLPSREEATQAEEADKRAAAKIASEAAATEKAAKRAAAKVAREEAAAAKAAERAAAKVAREEEAAAKAAERAAAKVAREEEAAAKASERAAAKVAREEAATAIATERAAAKVAREEEAAAKAEAAQAKAAEKAAMAPKKAAKQPPAPRAKPVKRRAPSPAPAAPPPSLAPSRSGRKRTAPAAHEDAPAAKRHATPTAAARIIDHSVPDFAMPGNSVWAKGWYASAHTWFKARVIKLRVSHPRIHVRYEEDANGSTHALSLPELDAYLYPADVAPLA
ncbi:hypothetical protein OAO87_00380 [bacterium]|nr:hypothetical protein [bacterium]